jgi:hypothetical protein
MTSNIFLDRKGIIMKNVLMKANLWAAFGILAVTGLANFSLADQQGSKIYFGGFEVQAGKLKSTDGSLPRAGDQVTLAVDVFGLSTTAACRPGEMRCASLEPRLYVRFSENETFQEVKGLPAGMINRRGPGTTFIYTGWESNQPYPVQLQVPANANRIEAFLVFNRYSFEASNCYLSYDMTECDISNQTFQGLAYISNYGKNFQIPVQSQ